VIAEKCDRISADISNISAKHIGFCFEENYENETEGAFYIIDGVCVVTPGDTFDGSGRG
jgi:hypothetical protein